MQQMKVKEIEALLKDTLEQYMNNNDAQELQRVIAQAAADERTSVQALAKRYQNKLDKQQKEQERVFRMIPGLANAKFVRYGQMHRNTYICAPGILSPSLNMLQHPGIFFSGQLCGVEGYMGNIAAGLLAGINAARYIKGKEPVVLPEEMVSGSLFHYIATADPKHFQPMKANFGILPPVEMKIRSKRERYLHYSNRALEKAASIFAEEL